MQLTWDFSLGFCVFPFSSAAAVTPGMLVILVGGVLERGELRRNRRAFLS